MTRSVWKGPFIDPNLLKKIDQDSNNRKKNKHIQTYSRTSVILPQFIGKTIKVHNGRKFISIKINSDMIGHKLGEFAPTRARYTYKKGKK